MKLKALTAVLAGMGLIVGCTLTKSDLREGAGALMPTIGGHGQLILPKQCALKMVIVARPATDAALQEILWRSADQQSVGEASRQALEANGLRLGIVSGDLPGEVRAIIEAPPPNQVDPSTVIVPDGESTVVDLAPARPEADLLLNRQGSVSGRRYKDARGRLRLTTSRTGETGVAIRIVPELHHGPVRQGWGSAPGGSGPFAPQQLVMRNGQEEESFRDLAATANLHAGQVLVVSALPDRPGSLGHFLFSTNEPNSDRTLLKVLFVWASRSEDAPSQPNLTPAEPPADPAISARRGAAPARTTLANAESKR